MVVGGRGLNPPVPRPPAFWSDQTNIFSYSKFLNFNIYTRTYISFTLKY